MYFVYVLYSPKFKRHYVGLTQDIEKRLNEHNLAKTKSTKCFVPLIRIHSETYATLAEARQREKYLKSAAGRRWRKENLNWPRSSTE